MIFLILITNLVDFITFFILCFKENFYLIFVFKNLIIDFTILTVIILVYNE